MRVQEPLPSLCAHSPSSGPRTQGEAGAGVQRHGGHGHPQLPCSAQGLLVG